MTRRSPLVVASLAALSSSAFALPPGAPPALRQGANHHVGDDSFVAKFGRAPTARDDERVRMTTHLRHVHDWLASRPATRPELAKRRASLLAAFDAYIAKGTTPKNADLPWRTPVFIDQEGTICAVGFLIQESAGRPLAEKIAKHHRYDFIEDIAAAMPEVRDWVAGSGFTLEEISSIQPAYDAPHADEWRSWDLAKYPAHDGPSTRYGTGEFHHNHMEGAWSVLARAPETSDGDDGKPVDGHDAAKVVVGRGTLHHGAGTWQSFYATGEKLAEGRYADNEPSGPWKIFHKSGNLAAEGSFRAGTRVGRWHFYYDTPAKTPIAIGSFDGFGGVDGRWKHFDSNGQLVARSWIETPKVWGDRDFSINGGAGSMLEVVPGEDGVAHAIHQGTPGVDVEFNQYSLEMFAKDGERLYLVDDLHHEAMYGADGALLVHDETGWHGRDCRWSANRKRVASAGDVPQLHGLLSSDALRRASANKDDRSADPGPTCTGELAIAPARARRLDVLLASRDRIRAATPAMIRDLVLGQEDARPDSDRDDTDDANAREQRKHASDLVRVLAGSMAMYVEWPHVDRRFDEVYATMAGRFTAHWAAYSEAMRDVNGRGED